MLYFPPPNLEYTSDIKIGEYTTANTGSVPTNQLYCNLPRADIGDTLLAFVHANYTSSTVFPATTGWTSTLGYGYTPNNGQVTVYYKKYNGLDTQIRLITENQSVLADISVLVMCVKGMNPLVGNAYYSAGAGFIVSNGVTMPTLTINQRPFIPNFILFGMYGGVVNTQYTSSDTPSNHTYLTTIGTANTSALISYIKSTNTNLSLTTNFLPTTGGRAALLGYFQADKRSIGDTSGINTSNQNYEDTLEHYLIIRNHFLKKASGYEEIYEFVFEVATAYPYTPDGVFEIGLYDVTNGYSNAPLCLSVSTNKIIGSSINRIPITPYKLTKDRTYAIAFRSSISAAGSSYYMRLGYAYSGGGNIRKSTFTGKYPLQATWSDSGLTSDARYSVGASVRHTKAAIGKILKQIPAKINQLNPKLKQPIGPVLINDSSPLSKKLVFHYATHNETSYGTSILYGKLPAKINSTMRPHLGTSFGKGLDFYETAFGGRIKGISFGQRSQYVLTGLETEFSVAFWAKWTLQDGVNRSNILLAKGISGSTTQDWLIGGSEYTISTARPSYRAGGVDFTIPGSVSLNKWYRCVVTKKGTNGAWYINGKLENTTTTFPTYTPNANNRYLVMGQNVTDAKSSFYGIPHSIMIWHKALSQQEILLDYIDTYSPFISLLDLENHYAEVFSFAVDSVDDDNIIYNNQTVVIKGKDFGPIQGLVYIDNIQQTIVLWKDTEIQINVSQSSLGFSTYALRIYKPK